MNSMPYICTPKKFGVMKEGIHPENYRLVVFKDMSNDYAFLSKSAAETKETVKWEDGNEYPLVKVEVSHKSHPFYTGKARSSTRLAESTSSVRSTGSSTRSKTKHNSIVFALKKPATAGFFCVHLLRVSASAECAQW